MSLWLCLTCRHSNGSGTVIGSCLSTENSTARFERRCAVRRNRMEDADIANLREENKRLKEELRKRDEELTLEEYSRYGRQLIMPEVGLKGQLGLKNSKVLVVGAGGLGCPALAYIAGAGVGTIGIVDNDTVDSSNLHRQVLHSTAKVGMLKSESARRFISDLNPNVNVVIHSERLLPTNSFDIFAGYDLVLDCTDTPATRYLINDTSVLLGIPLVSASALKTDGQLSILNYKEGPCYRCLFPIPPPPDSVLSCGDGGIIGPVVGIMGVMQAIETIKILTGAYEGEEGFTPGLTIFSAYSSPQWRYMRMRSRKKNCKACGEDAEITKAKIINGDVDYVEFCGRPTTVAIAPEERVSVEDYSAILRGSKPHTLLDVREKPQYEICALPNSINTPFMNLNNGTLTLEKEQLKEPVYLVCRYGNDSQRGVKLIKEQLGLDQVYDIKGGLDKWSQDIDQLFPRY